MTDIVREIEIRNAAEHGLTLAYDQHLLRRTADEIGQLRCLAVRAWHSFRSGGLTHGNGCDAGLRDEDIEVLVEMANEEAGEDSA